MNRSIAVRRLWWKEIRQLWPLVGMLIVLALLLQLVELLSQNTMDWQQAAVLLGMPGLFAAGAGALLVGQEKELRTLDWLRSLPLPAVDLARTKLLVGFCGLAIIWLVSLLIALASGSLNVIRDGAGGEWIWPMHSVFLLLLGFATAWYLRSSLVSLLVVVPLACLPLICANLHEFLWATRSWEHIEPRPWVMAIYLGIFSVVALICGWRAALHSLAPEQPTQAARGSSRQTTRETYVAYARVEPASSLLWQFLAQNRAALIGVSLLLIVGLLSGLSGGIWLGALPGFLAGSWLGLIVFQGDALHRRKMFLADRGVSPTLTWLTRQAMPILLALVALALLVPIMRQEARQSFGVNDWLIGAAWILSIYGTAQWIGQLLQSPIVGGIAAPVAALLMSSFLVYVGIELGAAWWAILLTVCLPLLATFVATSAWMDGRTDWRFWSWHAFILALTILIPISGFLSYMAMYPRMSSASRDELRRIPLPPQSQWINQVSLSEMDTSPADTIDPLPEDDPGAGSGKLSPPLWTVDEYRRSTLDIMRNGLNVSAVAPVNNWPMVSACIAQAVLDRTADPQAKDPVRSNRYREMIRLIFEDAENQRRGLQLVNQDLADMFQMILVEELQQPLALQRLGSELYDSLISVLSDSNLRDELRRAALANSWRLSATSRARATSNLGGYDIHMAQHGRVTTRDVWDATRTVDLVSERLLKLSKANADLERRKLRVEIDTLMGYRASSPLDSFYTESGKGRELLFYEIAYALRPGLFWHGDWETVAQRLAAEANESTQNDSAEVATP